MRVSNSKHLYTALAFLLFQGCATWQGEVVVSRWERRQKIDKPKTKVDVVVYMEKPTITTSDGEEDLEAFREKFIDGLYKAQKFYLEEYGAFTRLSKEKTRDSFLLRSRYHFDNFRTPRGGTALLLVGGLLLPPVVGLIWAFPTVWGNMEGYAEYRLLSPGGETLVRAKKWFDVFAPERPASFRLFSEKWLKFLGDCRKSFQKTRIRRIVETNVKGSYDPSRSGGGRVVATVSKVNDKTGKISPKNVYQLTEYLSAQLIEKSGLLVVPQKQLRKQLLELKKEGYEHCYDEQCQIELGKALSAQKTIATSIDRIAEVCIVSSIVYDIRSETTESATSVETNCGIESIVDAIPSLAVKLTVILK